MLEKIEILEMALGLEKFVEVLCVEVETQLKAAQVCVGCTIGGPR